MKYKFSLCTFAVFVLGKCSSCFTRSDIDLTFSLIQPLEISSCVFVKKFCRQLPQMLSISKEFSRNNFYFSYFDFDDFLKHFAKGEIPLKRTMIVLQAINETDAFSMVEKLTRKACSKKYGSFPWIMILPENMTKFNQENLLVPFDCQFIIAQKSGLGFELFEIFQVKNDLELIYAKFGDWDQTGINTQCCGVSIDTNIYARRKKYLSGVEIIAKVCVDRFECYMQGVWSNVEKSLNFSTTYITFKDLRKRGKRSRYDIKCFNKPFHIINPDTSDMLAPVASFKVNAFIRFESDDEQSWASYLRPFHTDMWVALSSWVLVSAVIATVIALLTKSFLAVTGFAILDHTFTPLTAITCQSCPENPTTRSSRIASLVARTVACIIIPAYSAAIISYLTVERPMLPFNSLESFIQDGSYKMSSFNNPFTQFLIYLSDDPYLNIIKERQLIVPFDEFPTDTPEMAQMLCEKEKIAMLTIGHLLSKQRAYCPFVVAIENAFIIPIGIQLQDDSPYKKIFNEVLFKAQRSGSLYKVRQYFRLSKDLLYIEQELQSINIQMTSSIFTLVIVGVILAFIVLTIETIWDYIRSCHAKNRPLFDAKRMRNFIKDYFDWFVFKIQIKRTRLNVQ